MAKGKMGAPANGGSSKKQKTGNFATLKRVAAVGNKHKGR